MSVMMLIHERQRRTADEMTELPSVHRRKSRRNLIRVALVYPTENAPSWGARLQVKQVDRQVRQMIVREKRQPLACPVHRRDNRGIVS